jgi:hypothetical protein
LNDENADAEDPNAGLLSQLANSDVQARSVWRIFAEVDTDHGSLLIKIPIYDPAIEDVIRSCLK